ncbi:VOC family protein [Flexivirga oryzae]|uniref:Putative glyoxalase superfamily protein PhnB n=1 Tax=Flexivirga oryzae TaxID=1794944 RepID=A0A839N3J7_9MICO|nr:VOC family protein [Flexivirga oryzae]MBB2890533.1 putative glyoxalase superfamily protein PhnB [Flexivirga oryzae]
MSNRTLFHSLGFRDVPAAVRFLEAVGFVEAVRYTDPDDDSLLVHAQYNWRDTGGVMFGQIASRNDSERAVESAGHGQCYCVVEQAADVDRIHEAALGAGGRSVRAPQEPPYGGRICAVLDPEGNQWSFGTYADA